MEGFATGRISPKATKAELLAILEKEVAFAKDRDAQREKRIAELCTRRNDLQEANNRYLERARNAEAGQRVAEREMMAALDRIDFMQGEYDAAVRQHLEQDTWARMEIEKQKSEVSAWTEEAKTWAKAYAELRQKVDTYTIRLGIWIKGLKQLAFKGMFLDVILWLTAIAVITGLVPPAIWGR